LINKRIGRISHQGGPGPGTFHFEFSKCDAAVKEKITYLVRRHLKTIPPPDREEPLVMRLPVKFTYAERSYSTGKHPQAVDVVYDVA